jgi:organic radical activating enzyme
MKYPIVEIFFTIQGEGHLRGFQQTFIRLAGCSVRCPQCDTDYSARETLTAEEIAERAAAITPKMIDPWAWITGGEPADHDLRALLAALKEKRFSTAVATSGQKRVIPPVDWISVSPHRTDFLQRYGNEIKIVPGLNGMSLDDWDAALATTAFMYRYVQPLWIDGREDPESMQQCLAFMKTHPDWALSRQDHKHWNVA